jgi:putative lipoic acid-binding regulatory protein
LRGETAVLFDGRRKPQIDYPCSWEYRVIGSDEFALRQAVAEVMADLEYEVSFSHFSRTGKYCSLSVELTVTDEGQRRSLFAALKKHGDILLVL